MLPTFPSRYWYTIGLPGVFSLAAWSPQIQTGFHVSRPTQVVPLNPKLARTGLSPSAARLSRRFRFVSDFLWTLLQPRIPRKVHGLGSSHFDRHYSGNRDFFLFLQVLRCFSSLRTLQANLATGLQPDGFPHSDIPGSIPVCRSPGLFAAYHVLLRFRKPRHPPFALVLFLFNNEYCL